MFDYMVNSIYSTAQNIANLDSIAGSLYAVQYNCIMYCSSLKCYCLNPKIPGYSNLAYLKFRGSSKLSTLPEFYLPSFGSKLSTPGILRYSILSHSENQGSSELSTPYFEVLNSELPNFRAIRFWGTQFWPTL